MASEENKHKNIGLVFLYVHDSNAQFSKQGLVGISACIHGAIYECDICMYVCKLEV